MIRITLMDGSLQEIPREEALEILTYRHVLQNKFLKAPIEGLIVHRGKVIPVMGPLPQPGDETNEFEIRPWILLTKDRAQVILGMPDFQEKSIAQNAPEQDKEDEEKILSELDH